MTDEKDQASGTLPDDPQDGSAQEATGTVDDQVDGGSDLDTEDVAALQARVQELERHKAQLLSEKSRVEAETRRLAEERAYQPPTYDPQERQTQAELLQIQADIEEVQKFAPHDAQARLFLRSLQQQARDKQNFLTELDFRRLSEPDEELARKYYATGEYKTAKAALKAAKGDLYEQERQQLERDKKRIAVETEARKEGRVDTSVRSVGAAEVRSRQMSAAQFAARLQEADDADDFEAKRKLVLDRRNGAIKIKP